MIVIRFPTRRRHNGTAWTQQLSCKSPLHHVFIDSTVSLVTGAVLTQHTMLYVSGLCTLQESRDCGSRCYEHWSFVSLTVLPINYMYFMNYIADVSMDFHGTNLVRNSQSDIPRIAKWKYIVISASKWYHRSWLYEVKAAKHCAFEWLIKPTIRKMIPAVWIVDDIEWEHVLTLCRISHVLCTRVVFCFVCLWCYIS